MGADILNILAQSWKWIATIIEVMCLFCFTVPKIRNKVRDTIQNFIGLNEIKNSINSMKTQIEKIDSTLNSHLDKDKEKLAAQMYNLKESLMRSFHFYIDRGYITLEERNTLQDVYNSYRKFGGNGVFQSFWEEKILLLPDKPPKKQ